MKKVVILLSGGLDSSVLLALYKGLGYEVHPLYIDYGNINAPVELGKVDKLLEKFSISRDNFTILNLNFSWSNSGSLHEESSNPYVEMRNLIFISNAVSVAQSKGIDEVAIGFIKVESPYCDASEDFLEDINNTCCNSCGIAVEAPLMNLDKLGVYELGEKLGVSLKDTFSCNMSSEDKPCGECPDCLDIKELIRKAGIGDENNPFI